MDSLFDDITKRKTSGISHVIHTLSDDEFVEYVKEIEIIDDFEITHCSKDIITSANGIITFPYTSIRDGNEVKGIKLTYKNGEVTDCIAETNQKFMESMLELKGVKRIGELGLGCNYSIDRYIKNLLFDEKIGGTIHIAIGNSYKRTLDDGGGLNDGDIHWDLVCDLRRIADNPGGELYVNDKLVQKNGIWQFD